MEASKFSEITGAVCLAAPALVLPAFGRLPPSLDLTGLRQAATGSLNLTRLSAVGQKTRAGVPGLRTLGTPVSALLTGAGRRDVLPVVL